MCASYFHTGSCNAGATCIFDHPSLVPIHRNTSSPQLYRRGISSANVDSSSELVVAETKKRKIHKNTSKRRRIDKKTSSTDSVTQRLSPLRFSSSIGDSSVELVEASTLKLPIHKSAAFMAYETAHLSPLGLSFSLGSLSSEPVEPSSLSKVTQATVGIDDKDFWNFNEADVQRWVYPYANFDF